MVVVSFCGSAKEFDETNLVDLRVAVARHFLLEALAFDILSVNDNHATDADISSRRDLRIRADDKALLQLERQSHDYHNMKWALVREHLANLRSDFMELKKQNQLLEHSYHHVQTALEAERTTRDSLVQDLQSKLNAEKREKDDAIVKLERGTTRAIEVAVSALEEKISVSQSDISALRSVHDKDISETKKHIHFMVGEGSRNFQANQQQFEALGTKHDERFAELQKEHDTACATMESIRRDLESLGANATSSIDNLRAEHDKLRSVVSSNDKDCAKDFTSIGHKVQVLEQRTEEVDLLNREEFDALRKEFLQTCEEKVCVVSDNLTDAINRTSASFMQGIRKLEAERKAVESSMLEDFRPKIIDSQNQLVQIHERIKASELAARSQEQHVAEIESRMLEGDRQGRTALAQLRKTIDLHEEAHNDRHCGAQDNIHHIAEKIDAKVTSMEKEFKATMEKRTDELAKLVATEKLCRETTLNEQRNWMDNWKQEFCGAHQAKMSERDKEIADMIKDTRDSISTVASINLERSDTLRQKVEVENELLQNTVKEVEGELLAKMHGFMQKFDNVSLAMSNATDDRFETLTEDVIRSSNCTEDAGHKLNEVDLRIEALAKEMALVKKHVPMLFVTL